MKLLRSTSIVALASIASISMATPVLAQEQTDEETNQGRRLDTVTITAQRREETVQDAAIAVTAVQGDALVKDRVLNYSDLARSITSLSYTENSPLDQEFNIRGITNTRLDAPSSDQSIGIFVDDVYVGRSGLLNADFFDIDRVEVTRGPQGVLLGRNVVGGAVSIYTAKPEKDFSGAFNAELGNFDSRLFNGYVTGELFKDVAGRFSFQSRTRDGYNYDVLNQRDLDNLDSLQLRAQLLWQPESIEDLSVRIIADYMDDESNGVHRVAIPTNAASPGPWSVARSQVGAVIGELDIRESMPQSYTYFGENTPSDQELRREAYSLTVDVEKGLGDVAVLRAITGYRKGEAFSLYDQTGIGPNNGVLNPLTNLPNNPLLFAFPVNEDEEISQFSQEVRIVSDQADSPFDWIVGAYYQQDDIDKIDRFKAEIPLGIPTLNGESHWINNGENSNVAVFGQLGYALSDQIHITGGVRWSQDEKKGVVSGISRATGDVFNPADPVFLTPLIAEFSDVAYSDKTSEVTPQITIDYEPSDNILAYFTYSKGYKGGGFEDTAPNAAAAQISYDPETATNLELGLKLDLLDGRARINTAIFRIDYEDLQVTQTDDGCLCNITDNAADAEITGLETEVQFLATDNLFFFGGATFLETEYIDFVDSNGLDNSGNKLQRTPDSQFNMGAELTTDFFSMKDALTARLSYSYQGEMYWLPDNFQSEDSFGLLDGRVTVTSPDDKYSFSLWAKNLTDEEYRTNIIAFFGDEVSTLGAPRTFGMSLGAKF